LNRLRPRFGCQHESEKLEHGREIWSAPISISFGHAQNVSPELADTVAPATVIGANDRLVSYLQLKRVGDRGELGRSFLAMPQRSGKLGGSMPIT
jgi:hypothetical protein